MQPNISVVPFRFSPLTLTFWSACLLVISMVVSPFLLSISMWALVAAAFWHAANLLLATGGIRSMRSARAWWLVLRSSFVRLFEQRGLAALTLLLLVPALSFFWSDDLSYWLRLTRVRLPFLVLPWAFANLPTLSERQWKSVLYLLVWFMVGVCIAVGINFLRNYEVLLTDIGRGQPIPVPRSHVRFSLILATTILSGGWLWRERFCLYLHWERHLLAVAVLFLFFFIHVLSVRGGLLALYAALLFTVGWSVLNSRKWLLASGVCALLAAGLWIAAETMPSLRTRIAYMKYDWERYRSNDDGHLYSDGARWVSLCSGWEMWRQNPLFGTGAGDLLRENERITAEQFPTYAQEPKLPHNQFLFIMASTGLFGLLLSLIAFLLPFAAGRKNYLFTAFQVMAFSSFLVECTLENAIGVAWFLFFSLWFLKVQKPS